jgi:predicted DNA-binding protein (MmcQ/YjbR family)
MAHQRRNRPAARKPRAVRDLARDPLVVFCRSLPAATEDVKWGNDLVFSVGDKMFAGFLVPDGTPFGFKVAPEVFASLVEQPGIEPAPYLARHHWVSVTERRALPLRALEGFLAESHRLVAERLPRRMRRALGLEADE